VRFGAGIEAHFRAAGEFHKKPELSATLSRQQGKKTP
jgi:hypothetical protein